MTTSYKGYDDRPHFEGLWTPVEEKDERRRALLFLGDCYLVFFEYYPATKALNYSSQSYVLQDDRILMMPMQGDSAIEEEEMQVLYWNVTEGMELEIEQDGESSVWEPVLVETLTREGFPTRIIETYRTVYAQNGIPHSIVGVAPLPRRRQATGDLGKEEK